MFDNVDRRFDPSYAAGPYFGNILPNRQIRISATYNSITYRLFYGYIDAWPQNYKVPSSAFATVTATDGFKALANVPPALYYDQIIDADTPYHRWHLDEAFQYSTFNDTGTAASSGAGLPELLVRNTGITSTPVPALPGSSAFVPHVGGRPCLHFPALASTFVLTPTLPISLPFSFEFWIKTVGSWSSVSNILDADDGGTRNCTIWINTGGFVNIQVMDAVHANTRVTRSTASVLDGNPHHVVVAGANATTYTIIIDGVEGHTTVSSTGTGAPALIATGWTAQVWMPGGVHELYLSEIATYTYALTTAQANAHYVAGFTAAVSEKTGTRIGRALDAMSWPAALRNIETGVVTVLGYDPSTYGTLGYCQLVADTEDGQFYMDGQGRVTFRDANWRTETRSATPQATFGDSGSELGYGDLELNFDDSLVFNKIAVTNANGAVLTVDDATSRDDHFIKPYQRKTILQDDASALALANTILARYKDAAPRIESLTIRPQGAAANLYPQALGRDIGDKITVNYRPGTGTLITHDLYIEGIQHTVDSATSTWLTTWQLSAV